MRHLLANFVTYAIATLLLVGAALFAWMRSAQIIFSTERETLEQFRPRDDGQFDWEELGKTSYLRNCANCHLEDGSGWDQYPPLRHTVDLFLSAGGREYLIDVHLYGLTSDRYGAPMPTLRNLVDIELAAVLNHVLARMESDTPLPPSAPLYLPDAITARRDLGLSPWDVNRRRPRLRAQHHR